MTRRRIVRKWRRKGGVVCAHLNWFANNIPLPNGNMLVYMPAPDKCKYDDSKVFDYGTHCRNCRHYKPDGGTKGLYCKQK